MNAGNTAALALRDRLARLDRRATLALLAAGIAGAPGTTLADERDRDGPDVAALRRLLQGNILPFWRRVCTRSETEGYELSIDAEGKPLEPPGNRTLQLQSRTTYFFARLARSRYGGPLDLAIAARGFRFLTERMSDEANGGFYNAVAPAFPYGKADGTKQLVHHAHTLLALSEFALAAPSSATRARADEHADLIDARFRDPEILGEYVDVLNEDWSPRPPAPRGFNVRFRLVDALTSYWALQRAGGSAARQEFARARLAEAVALADGGLLTTPVHYFKTSSVNASTMTYNADLQAVHQQRRARDALGLDDRPEYARVIDDSLTYGEDRVLGGIYVSGPPGQLADILFKFGFAQAEALLATCDSWVRTGDEGHARAFRRTLRWILSRQADWANGDWHPSIPESSLNTSKASPFHPGRAVLHCLELLDGGRPVGPR